MQNQSKISVSNTIFENLSKQMIGIPPDLLMWCDDRMWCDKKEALKIFPVLQRQDRNKYWFNKFCFQREDIEMIFKIHSKLEYSSKGKRKWCFPYTIMYNSVCNWAWFVKFKRNKYWRKEKDPKTQTQVIHHGPDHWLEMVATFVALTILSKSCSTL